jgi:hypothetical protein
VTADAASRAESGVIPPGTIVATIAIAGLVAGTLDITDAFLFLTSPTFGPFKLAQFIASGVLGPASFAGGWLTAAAGMVFHFTIATSAAAVYVMAALKWRALAEMPAVWGPLFGLVVFAVMHYGVVPLSAAPKSATSSSALANLLFAHVCCVGLPIAFITNRSFAMADRGGPA